MILFRTYINCLLVCGILILRDKVAAECNSKTSIRQLHVVFRHGDRNPDFSETYPTDPYLEYNFYPDGRGELTNDGKMREYRLGENLRREYSTFLGSVVAPNTLLSTSSEYNRTKASLQLVHAGLFPPAKIQKWNTKLNWQPIPQSYIERPKDNLFLSDECSEYKMQYDKVLRSPEGQKAVAPYRSLMKELTKHTGKNISTLVETSNIYHGLFALYQAKLPLPNWAADQIPNGPMLNATLAGYEVGSFNKRLQRRYGGPFLRMFIDRMSGFVNGTLKDPRKIYLYSGHETNIAAIQIALGVFRRHVPAYSSAIIVELHELFSEYYVKIKYYRGIPPVMNTLTLPECAELCPLEEYQKLLKDVIPSDEELVCTKN